MRSLVMCLVAGALAVSGAAAPVAYVKGADGKWREVAAQEKEGRVSVALAPGDAAGGAVTLVVNKPDWMKLDDKAPPMLLSVLMGKTGVGTDGTLDFGTCDRDVPPITVRLADELNPVDPAGLRLDLPGLPSPPQIAPVKAGPPDKGAEFTIKLPPLAPGLYEGELSVRDMSPQANALRIPCRLSVFGVQIPADLSEIVLSSGAASYKMLKGPRLPLEAAGNGQSVYLTGWPPGDPMYPRQIASAKLIEDTAERKVCRVQTNVGDSEGGTITRPGRFEFDLEVRRDVPCMIVRSWAFNDIADGEMYAFWGWPGGASYETAKGRKEFTGHYGAIGKVGWVYIANSEASKPGLGWISPLDFGEGLGGSALLYNVPQRVPTKKGQSAEMRFALMPAKGASEVAKVAKRLEELGVWN